MCLFHLLQDVRCCTLIVHWSKVIFYRVLIFPCCKPYVRVVQNPRSIVDKGSNFSTNSQKSAKKRSAISSIAHRSLSDLSEDANFIHPGCRDGWEICEEPLSIRWKTIEVLRRKSLRGYWETNLLLRDCIASIERFGRDPAAMSLALGVINNSAKVPIYHSVCRLSKVQYK